MNNKILLLSVAILAVGLFAMPSTLTLFAGQHNFYSGPEVNCAKCHQDTVLEATGASGPHSTTIFSETGRDQCQGCHTTTNGTLGSIPVNKTNTSGTLDFNVTADPSVHASVSTECISCHSGVDEELQGTNESHATFYNLSSDDTDATNGTDMFRGGNEACIGCHTHIVVNVTWNRAVGYNMVVNESTTGDYEIAFTVNATKNTTYSSGS